MFSIRILSIITLLPILTAEFPPQKPQFQKAILCKASDFMQLRDKHIQDAFFRQLDSMLIVQFPNNDQEPDIMVDMTPAMLTRFLEDIDQQDLSKNGAFEHEYHFNIAPDGYFDPEICKDKIAMEFIPEDCRFRISILNTFLVEPDWCTESMVIYAFDIRDGHVINFSRNEAG